MFYVVDIYTKVKKLHNFSLKGKFIFSPTKQASSLNLSRGETDLEGPNEEFEASGSFKLESFKRGNRFGRSERGIGSSGEVKTDFRGCYRVYR
ncbi:hypothetical protein GQ457_15G019450 [Hibiscus cannabinus]